MCVSQEFSVLFMLKWFVFTSAHIFVLELGLIVGALVSIRRAPTTTESRELKVDHPSFPRRKLVDAEEVHLCEVPLPDKFMLPNVLQAESLGNANKLLTRNLALVHVAVDKLLKGFKH